MTFNGWGIPQENWSKLPHCFIEALPLVETLAEIKVILYVLRHTWGYQDDEKRISVDEFVNGRRYTRRYLERHPGTPDRIDGGIGMSANSVKDGIERAVKHGFIEVYTDDTDKARIRKYYSLSASNLGGQKLTPRPSKVDPLPSKVDPRTKKETLERNSERPDAQGAVSPEPGIYKTPDGREIEWVDPFGYRLPNGMRKQDLDSLMEFQDCAELIAIDLWCRANNDNGHKTPTLEKLDPVEHIVEQAGRREADPLWWLRPGTKCGDHDYLEPYQVFCGVIGRDPSTVGEHKTGQWLKKLGEIAVVSPGDNGSEPVIIQPGVMAQAIKAIRDDWNFEHKRWTSPFSDGFVGLVEHTAAQIMMGTLAGTESKGWSASL